MKRVPLLLTFLLCAAAFLPAENHWIVQGTAVRMKLADCLPERGFRATMSGMPVVKDSCPQYTVMSSRVVYVILGRHPEEFMPLAQNVHFAIRKNEVLVFGKNNKVQSHFVVKQMMLRSDWEREQALRERADQKPERSVSYDMNHPSAATMMATYPR